MPNIEFLRVLDSPKHVWVECDEIREFTPEAACLVPVVKQGSESQELIFVDLIHCRPEDKLLRGVRVATIPSNDSVWVVDFPSAERLFVPKLRVKDVEGASSGALV